MSVRSIRLILGDQLNINHSWFEKGDDGIIYVMAEQRSETDYTLHHAQKLIAVLSAMRRFAADLEARGHRLRYFRLGDADNPQNFPDTLATVVQEHKPARFEWQTPDEYRLQRIIAQAAEGFEREEGMEVREWGSEHFIAKAADFDPLMKNGKPPTMERFYRAMRGKTGILMSDGGPLGGRWNYDADNRSPLDDQADIIPPLRHPRDETALWDEIKAAGVRFFGNPNASAIAWPADRSQALEVLEHFLEHRLVDFGRYQDAMATGEPFLAHGLISFALNVKLISPMEVVEAAARRWERHAAVDPRLLASLEGFIRQVMGWREYMRQVYRVSMPGYERNNALSAKRNLPDWYWSGETDLNCLSQSIGQSLEHAYAHHIQRLMVTGNFAMLAGIDPDQVDQWDLGVYIDAFQWVEITNTRGMSQYADGGMVATKPYAASARYINRMSDYCKSCRFNPNKRHGGDACPFNSLYWHFLHRNRDVLGGNHRLAMPYKTWDRFGESERRAIIEYADDFLASL